MCTGTSAAAAVAEIAARADGAVETRAGAAPWPRPARCREPLREERPRGCGRIAGGGGTCPLRHKVQQLRLLLWGQRHSKLLLLFLLLFLFVLLLLLLLLLLLFLLLLLLHLLQTLRQCMRCQCTW